MIEYKEGVATIRLDINVKAMIKDIKEYDPEMAETDVRLFLWDSVADAIDELLSDHGRVRMTKEIMDKYYEV